MSHHVVRPSLRRVAAVAALAVVAAGAPALAADAPPVNGAAGIGDPYYADYGNGGYDVSHYGIDVAYTPSAKKSVADQVRGTTTIQATATQSLKRFDLDLVLTATKVEVDGVAATFAQPTNHELVVTPAKPIAEGAEFTVEVTYSGRPSLRTAHGISPWIRTDDGGAAAVGEPEIAGWWYPSNDHPRDKATFDIAVTVPTGMEVLSNGVLVSEDADSAPDTATWQWRETDPMATYLAFFAAGQYTISQSTHDGLPVITAVADDGGDEGTAAAADLARVPEIIDWEASKFGPYPFKALGGVAPAASFGFALENQTRPVYSRLFWQDGVSNIGVVVHEQAHQWFGDSVSVKNWKHIWLNEGFATFTEWLWDEDHDGPTAAEYFKAYYAIPRSDPFWKTRIGDPGAGKEFGDAVYVRGGMALQALRTRVGEATFLDILQTWAASKKGGNGSIAEFRALAEAKSGLDLDSFFTYWLYTGSRPNPIRSNGFPADFGKQKAASPRDVATFDERQELLRKSGD